MKKITLFFIVLLICAGLVIVTSQEKTPPTQENNILESQPFSDKPEEEKSSENNLKDEPSYIYGSEILTNINKSNNTIVVTSGDGLYKSVIRFDEEIQYTPERISFISSPKDKKIYFDWPDILFEFDKEKNEFHLVSDYNSELYWFMKETNKKGLDLFANVFAETGGSAVIYITPTLDSDVWLMIVSQRTHYEIGYEKPYPTDIQNKIDLREAEIKDFRKFIDSLEFLPI